MFKRLALAIAVLGAPACAQSLTFVSAIKLSHPADTFGGISGIEVDANGGTALVVSDRGYFFDLTFARNADDNITGVTVTQSEIAALDRDAEGLAVRGDQIIVSFEGPAQVRPLGAKALPRHPDFSKLQHNSALEALAIDDQGTLYTLPERSGRLDKPFPLYAFKNGAWEIVAHIPRDGSFLPVGADFGPDGLFYLLERSFTPLTFRTRIRRFDLSAPDLAELELLRTPVARHDNLEGISVWRDRAGQIRLTLVSDDNFLAVLRNEVVEYVVQE